MVAWCNSGRYKRREPSYTVDWNSSTEASRETFLGRSEAAERNRKRRLQRISTLLVVGTNATTSDFTNQHEGIRSLAPQPMRGALADRSLPVLALVTDWSQTVCYAIHHDVMAS